MSDLLSDLANVIVNDDKAPDIEFYADPQGRSVQKLLGPAVLEWRPLPAFMAFPDTWLGVSVVMYTRENLVWRIPSFWVEVVRVLRGNQSSSFHDHITNSVIIAMTEQIQVIVAPGELPRMTRQVIDAVVGAGIGRQVPGFYDRAWLADQIEQVVDFRKRGLNLIPVGCPPKLISRVYAVWRDVVKEDEVS